MWSCFSQDGRQQNTEIRKKITKLDVIDVMFITTFPSSRFRVSHFLPLGFGKSVVGGVGPFSYLETVLPLRSILQCEIQLNHIQSWHKTERDQCHSTVSCDPGTFWPEDTGSGHTPGTQKIKFNWNHFLKLCIHCWKIRPSSLIFDAIPTELAMFTVVGFMLDYYLGYPVARSGSLLIKSMPTTLITNTIAFVLDSKNLHPKCHIVMVCPFNLFTNILFFYFFFC